MKEAARSAEAVDLISFLHSDSPFERTKHHSEPTNGSAWRVAAFYGLSDILPSPPFRRDSTTATRLGKFDPIRRGPFLPSAALNARPFCLGNMGELSPCSVNAVGWFPSGKSSLI